MGYSQINSSKTGKVSENVNSIFDSHVNNNGWNSSRKERYEYLVNLKSNDVTTVFASFYNILMNSLSGDKFILFTSYLSFLIFEV